MLTTEAAKTAVNKLTINHGIRLLNDSLTVESKRYSESTPPNKLISSVFSS